MENLPSDEIPQSPPLPETDIAPITVSNEVLETEGTGAVPARPARPPHSVWPALAVGVLYLAFFRISSMIPTGHIAVVGTTTFLSLLLVLFFTVRTAQALSAAKVMAVSLLLSTVMALPLVLVPILFSQSPHWPGWQHYLPLFGRYALFVYRSVPGLGGLLLIWFAVSIGASLSRMVREVKILLPMAVILAVVDLYVVFGGGLVTQAQSGKSQTAGIAMKALTVSLPGRLPSAGAKMGAEPMQLAVGFADFLFIALFFACFARFGISAKRTFVVLCAVLVAYMLLVAVKGWALPALVPIAVVVIGMNLREFRYERSEGFALLYAGLIVAAILGGFYFMSHH